MRNFKKLPGQGPGLDGQALPQSQIVPGTPGSIEVSTNGRGAPVWIPAPDADPERVGNLIHVAPGGVHLHTLRPVYRQEPGHPLQASMYRPKGRNTSKVKRAGRP